MTEEEKLQQEKLQQQSAEQVIQAPPPPAFLRDVLNEQKAGTLKPADDREDIVIAEGAESEFWKLLKGQIENKMRNLNRMTEERITAMDFNLQEIGYRSLLSSQITHALADVINFVENRRRAIEVINKEKEEREQSTAGAGSKQ